MSTGIAFNRVVAVDGKPHIATTNDGQEARKYVAIGNYAQRIVRKITGCGNGITDADLKNAIRTVLPYSSGLSDFSTYRELCTLLYLIKKCGPRLLADAATDDADDTVDARPWRQGRRQQPPTTGDTGDARPWQQERRQQPPMPVVYGPHGHFGLSPEKIARAPSKMFGKGG
jgi:hypothetical protein